MQRFIFALLVALVLAALSGLAVRALSTSGVLAVDVSDGDGHGPDEGSPEWRAAVERAIPLRAACAGTLIGVTGFFVALRVLRPAHHPPT